MLTCASRGGGPRKGLFREVRLNTTSGLQGPRRCLLTCTSRGGGPREGLFRDVQLNTASGLQQVSRHGLQEDRPRHPQSHGPDKDPSGNVGSRDPSHTARSVMPQRASEALAHVPLLLCFPPPPDNMDKWRATIQILVGFVNADRPSQSGPSWRPPMAPTRDVGERTGSAPTVQSPPRQAP